MGDDLRESLANLGRKIAAAEDAQLDQLVERARARFEAPPARARAHATRSAVRHVWVLAAAAALVVAFLFVRGRWSASTAHESPRGGAKTLALASSSDTALRFSDGSTVLLGTDAQGRVVELTPAGARIAIARGRASVSIPVPVRVDGRWSFDVGPFALVVSGARFDTSWDPKTQVFELEPLEGDIHVSGPTIIGDRVVTAGQKLRLAIAIAEGALDETPAAPESPVSPAIASAQRAPAAASAARAAPPARSWRALSADGRYTEAMDAVSSTFDSELASAPSGDVFALGDTARLAGDTERAARAYEAARARFAGSSDAGLAAFALGRMAAKNGHDAEAARWFSTYLRERPGDRLAREALGRLLEARDRNGESAAARTLAGEYLAKFPDGPHAKLARKIQGE